jgi:hypothetical protein
MSLGWISQSRQSERIFDEVRSDIKGGGSTNMCVACKGSRLLCGKDRCPVLAKYHAYSKSKELTLSDSIAGSSPPSVFIGRFGYPKVFIGPLVPPVMGDTSLMDLPEQWPGMTIEDIVSMRMQLVRGMHRVEVTNVDNGGRLVDDTRELALGSISASMEAEFLRRPTGRLTFDTEVQPFGPSAPLRNMNLGNIKIDHRVDRAYSDTDLKAADAIVHLYGNEIMVSRIQKAFSVGAFGIGKRRRFVPTRWSITAVDDILGKSLLERTRNAPLINEFEVYETEELDNRWQILMMPCSWRYELIEAWYPRSVWNPYGEGIVLFSDYEFYKPRRKYAKIGGCYYSARLAVNENLTARNRQAGVVIFREAHPGYIMPVGVWNVRENVRKAVRGQPKKFDTLSRALDHISKKMAIPMKRWINTSGILKDMLYQRRLEDFLDPKKKHLEPTMEEEHGHKGCES